MKTTLAGWASGILTFLSQPDIKHAVLGLLLALLGHFAQDARTIQKVSKSDA